MLQITILVCFISVSVLASSPGMIEGPPGCTWKASVVGAASKTTPLIQVKLEDLTGCCTYYAHPGTKGQIVGVAPKKDSQPVKVGQSVQVWLESIGGSLTDFNASLDVPGCWTKPIPEKR